MQLKAKRNRHPGWKGFVNENPEGQIMVQVAAALLFALAAGLGITVILAMLKSNETAILSALLGEGAFPVATSPESDPAVSALPIHRTNARRAVPRRMPVAMAVRPQFSRAA
jgi:hypothetical protein